MRKETVNADEYFTYPTSAEIKAAQKACCGKCCVSCETPAAYAWRRRDIDMAALLRLAIERELTDTENEITKLFWFENMSIAEITASRGINQSAVSRTLERAKAKLAQALCYAVEYQRSISEETVIHTALRRAAVVAAARERRGESFGERLRLLRVGENLSRTMLAQGLEISDSRLRAVEEGKTQPTADEIISVSAYFGKSTDFLLKGDSQ